MCTTGHPLFPLALLSSQVCMYVCTSHEGLSSAGCVLSDALIVDRPVSPREALRTRLGQRFGTAAAATTSSSSSSSPPAVKTERSFESLSDGCLHHILKAKAINHRQQRGNTC